MNLTEQQTIDLAQHKEYLATDGLAGSRLDWHGVDLSDADLSRADLREADLREADLSRASLSGVDLSGANLNGADLDGANLNGADLDGADLTGVSLTEVNLTGTSLSAANLLSIKQDIWEVLDQNSHEVPFLLLALQEGRVDGSSYDKECACLFGTIAHAKQVDYRTLNGIDSNRPCEKWFLSIRKTRPSEHPVTAITEEWILEWQANQ